MEEIKKIKDDWLKQNSFFQKYRKQRRSLFATRERAYEQILYLILEDIRKKNAA